MSPLDIPGLDAEIGPHDKFGLVGNKPWFEFVEDFLDNPNEMIAWLHAQPNWHKEDGYCPTASRPMKDQHSTIQ